MKDLINPPKDSNFHVQYFHNKKTNEWEFRGYYCVKCERTLKFSHALERHANNCKKRNPKVYKVDPTPTYVRDLEGKPWTPLDFNQILTNSKDSQDIES